MGDSVWEVRVLDRSDSLGSKAQSSFPRVSSAPVFNLSRRASTSVDNGFCSLSSTRSTSPSHPATLVDKINVSWPNECYISCLGRFVLRR